MIRPDGRHAAQLRPVEIMPGYLKTAEGSALITVGNTRVLCAATVEQGVPPWLRNTGKGWVTAEYSMLPRATSTRTPREVAKGRQSGRTHEIQRLIGRSLRAIVDLDMLGEKSIIVDCDVLQADGGTRVASVTGAYVALALAIQQMVAFKMIPKSPLTGAVAAVSVGMLRGEAILDLCAAPGGKTALIGQWMGNQGRLAAHDAFVDRLDLLRENAARLGVTGVEVTSSLEAEAAASFDRILIDAPCSNTGVMRRRVDLRWRIRPSDLEALRRTQIGLLRVAAPLLKPGGILIYSTCSLEPEENRGTVEPFLSAHADFELQNERALLPFVAGVDGAYVVALRKRG